MLALAGLATAGCVVVPVPLPGIKSGRDVDESTHKDIVVGTPMAEVLLRLGEPDSVSADGRKFAYRFSRTWGLVLVAIGGYGAGAADALPVQYGEAVVIEFDANDQVVRADRRGGSWEDARPDDEPIFYTADTIAAMRLGGEAVLDQRRVLWWLGPRPTDPGADRRPIGLPPWTASSYGLTEFTAPGNLLLTASTLWLRPAFATGTAASDFVRIPRESIEAIVPFERGNPHEQTLLLMRDGRALALQPPSSARSAPAILADWLLDQCAPAGDAGQSPPQEGWVVWVSTKAEKGKPRPATRFSCLWLTASGLRFEHFEFDGRSVGGEFLDWTAIERIDPGSRNRTIIGVQIASADIVCRDGRTLCVAQSAPVTDTTRLAEALRAGWQRSRTVP